MGLLKIFVLFITSFYFMQAGFFPCHRVLSPVDNYRGWELRHEELKFLLLHRQQIL